MNKTLLFSLAVEAETATDSFSDYVEPNFPRWFTVVLFLIGTLGNILSLSIFHKMNVKNNSTYLYLTFLCYIDIAVTILGLGDIIVVYYTGTFLRNTSVYICRTHTYLLYTCTHLSSFILAAVSIDRAIAVTSINFGRKYCKPNIAYKVIWINFFVAGLLNFHTLLFLGFNSSDFDNTDIMNKNVNSTNSTHFFKCSTIAGDWYDKFLYPYFDWIDLLFYTIIPFFVMAVCTVMIVKVLYNSKKRLNRMSESRKSQESFLDSSKRSGSRTVKNTVIVSSNAKRKNKTIHLTYTLISINILFFCLMLPLCVARIFLNGYPDLKFTQNLKNFYNIFYMLAYSNHVFNFVFYGLSSELYRETMFKIFYLDRLCKILFKKQTPV